MAAAEKALRTRRIPSPGSAWFVRRSASIPLSEAEGSEAEGSKAGGTGAGRPATGAVHASSNQGPEHLGASRAEDSPKEVVISSMTPGARLQHALLAAPLVLPSSERSRQGRRMMTL